MLPRLRPTAAAARLVGLVLLVSGASVGCTGEQPTGTSPLETSRSGHGTAHLAEIPTPPDSADWNVADATSLTMMVPHHAQALAMADLAEARAEDRRVLALARSIDRGQSREIVVMATWLVDHGLPEPTRADVEAMNAMAGSAGGMVGMLSPDQMSALAAAEGADFDRLFLTGMIQHHQGAVAMADELLAQGEDIRVTEMATDVVAVQNGEIRRMEDLLGDL